MTRRLRTRALLRPLALLVALMLCAAPLHAAVIGPQPLRIYNVGKYTLCALGLGLATGWGIVFSAIGCLLLLQTDAS
jgi:hypothetical protein